MDGTYWSAEDCAWVACPAHPEPYWSVQRCRWEPSGPATDALGTPWSMFREQPRARALPQQREPLPAPVDA